MQIHENLILITKSFIFDHEMQLFCHTIFHKINVFKTRSCALADIKKKPILVSVII